MKRLNYITIIWWNTVFSVSNFSFSLYFWRTQEKYDHPPCSLLEWVWLWWHRLGNSAVTLLRSFFPLPPSFRMENAHDICVFIYRHKHVDLLYTQSLTCSSWPDFCKLFKICTVHQCWYSNIKYLEKSEHKKCLFQRKILNKKKNVYFTWVLNTLLCKVNAYVHTYQAAKHVVQRNSILNYSIPHSNEHRICYGLL